MISTLFLDLIPLLQRINCNVFFRIVHLKLPCINNKGQPEIHDPDVNIWPRISCKSYIGDHIKFVQLGRSNVSIKYILVVS